LSLSLINHDLKTYPCS